MKNLSKIIAYSILGLLLVSAFSLIGTANAQAQYYGGYGYNNTAAIYGTTITNRYGYNRVSYPTPVPVPIPVSYPVAVSYPVTYPVSTPITYPVSYPTYYPPIYVSCTANTTSVQAGTPVTWTAYVSGNNGYADYSWSGSDISAAYGQSMSITYVTPGQKLASVTVNANGQTVTQNCNTAVTVYGTYYNQYNQYNQYPVYQPTVQQPIVYQQPIYQSNNSGLDIGCYVDPANAKVGDPVTWSVEVSGGLAPYTYSWTGTDGLSGNQSSVIKYYNTTGSKSAIVSVTSADGRSGTRACSGTLTIASAYRAPVKPATTPTVAPTPTPTPSPANGQSAGLFSLSNVPWGWVAILIILVLFATVMYLLFNRQKI